MTDTTWRAPEGKPEDEYGPEYWGWKDRRDSEWRGWFGQHFIGWWTTDARGGVVDLDSDVLDRANENTQYLVVCKPCGATLIAFAHSDDQPYLNAHRAHHDWLDLLFSSLGSEDHR